MKNELDDALDNIEKLENEKLTTTQQLRDARDELQNIHSDFEYLKKSSKEDLQKSLDNNGQVLQDHYQRTLTQQLDQV